MQLTLQLISWAIGLPLGLLVIAALLRGGYRQFPVLFVYQIVDLLMTIAGMQPYIAHYFYHDPGARVQMAKWFWWDELLLQPLVTAVVISLMYRATEKVRSRALVRGAFICGAAVIAGASFLYHYDPNGPNGSWMAFLTRDLQFSLAILDLAVWMLLISSRIKDTRLLLVSGALGIQFAGEAIGETLRSWAEPRRLRTLSYSGSLITTLVDLLSLYLIWQAFRTAKNTHAKKKAAL